MEANSESKLKIIKEIDVGECLACVKAKFAQ